ncbi:uncharacterized protein CLUP02_15786 [Colletotrichum lupini]|uniref:CorA-like Mg2+ transporter n=1 Tax=Colletotrichum lupini TaxID=145971 RepID=A0A9Q8T6R5_9PEZI|nr:uncharacterized protein CLUP02_15786 [Colletotrichum lupini]KAK1714480.1 hypothetical protein BDP67DRAFT_514181 [Colletotrichum lupini]UQC90256.1 hypothetical protein CLUP02_15786 [Colletotrichum lupini]
MLPGFSIEDKPEPLYIESSVTMEWASETGSFKTADLQNVFRYGQQKTTVASFLRDQRVITSNTTPEDWQSWLKTHTPSVHKDSGLVLIIAQKPAEAAKRSFGTEHLQDSNFSDLNQEAIGKEDIQFGCLENEDEISSGLSVPDDSRYADPEKVMKGGKREVRQLPFCQSAFEDICRRFFVHSSIARTVSRADVPLFSRSYIATKLGDVTSVSHPSVVYQVRSSNTWADDMALTATYFPHTQLTFAILFGCPANIERHILGRLSRVKQYSSYPLVLPAIFAELESDRMKTVVKATVKAIEDEILKSGVGGSSGPREVEMRESRKNAWLNTNNLRNSLRIWKEQLRKMAEQVAELSRIHQGEMIEGVFWQDKCENQLRNDAAMKSSMERTGAMIHDQLQLLIEDHEDKIQDCTVGIEGMTIATQWAQGDTNVDIATATSQDSKQMRSIALLTMVFLPGTFFASLFSMTFFNWSPEDGKTSIVSSYIWIYFLITGIFTAFTLFLWWYFLSSRKKRYTID